MNRYNWRLILGVLFLLMGALALLVNFGVLPSEGSVMGWFIGMIFVAGGLAFLSVLFANRTQWWAVIPGVILICIGVIIVLNLVFPSADERISGVIMVGGIALAFWAVYALAPENWWAIIPAGVMSTVTLMVALPEAVTGSLMMGGIFFLGLALTFALVALLPRSVKNHWAWIPAGVLAVMGVLIMLSATELLNTLWPLALIVVGLFLVGRVVLKK